MAAPESKTIHDLNGTWALNKTLSDDVDKALSIQGIGWITRKAIGLASVTLHVKQYKTDDGKVHIDIEQTATGGLKGTSEQRELDNTFREHKDWLFGRVRGRSALAEGEIPDDDAFLKKDWVAGTTEWIYNYVESLDSNWHAKQTWGFQTINGERRHVRNVVVATDKDRAEIKMVYDFLSDKP